MTDKVFTMTRDEFDAVTRLKANWRPDPTFSTNGKKKIWISKDRGNTPDEYRHYIQGQSRIIDAIAAEYREIRPGGGRFFIEQTEAYFCPEYEPQQRIVLLQIAG
jgi:hypothetical protein